MYAIIITAKTTMTPEEIPEKAKLMAQALLDSGAYAGLMFKTFFHSGNTIGGFHLFTDRAAGEAFLEGPFWTRAAESPWVSEIDIRHYRVCDEASRLNGTPTTAFAETAAA